MSDLQNRREQMSMGGEQKSQQDWKQQHPLAHRHPRDDMVDQVGGRLCHAPGATGGANSAPLTGECHELLLGAVCAAQAQKTMSQDAALEKSFELVFDKLGQARPGFTLDLDKERLGVLLYQSVQRRLLRSPALVVYTQSCRRSLNCFVHRP